VLATLQCLPSADSDAARDINNPRNETPWAGLLDPRGREVGLHLTLVFVGWFMLNLLLVP
jgi:hypothetical protein